MPRKKKPPDKSEPPDLTRKKLNYKTIKTSLKLIIKEDNVLKQINDLVIRCNHIVINTYQFIRLYCLHLYHNKNEIPKLNTSFIGYCIKVLGKRDNRGKKSNDNDLSKLRSFYEEEYEPIYNHQKFDLTGLTFTTPYISNDCCDS
jgi:hypothetical protein